MYWRNDGNEMYKKRRDAGAEFVFSPTKPG